MDLWTPANLATPFKIICDCRSVTWNINDWSSQPNDGSSGGSWALSRAGVPVKGTAINSVTPINFNGSKGLKLASQTLGTEIYIFWCGKISASGRNTIVGHDWTTSGSAFVAYARDNEISHAGRYLGSGVNGFTTTSDLLSTNHHIGSLKYSSASTDLRVNGVAASRSNVGSGANPSAAHTDDLSIADSGPTFGPEGWVGDVFYAAVLDSFPTDAEIEKLEGWASWTFAGDGSLLPVGHTYKSAAPEQTTVAADGGSYALSGAVATLKTGLLVTAENSSYAISGSDATLIYTPASLLTAEGSSYSISGASAALRNTRVIAAAGSSYAITGANATLAKTAYAIAANSGAYNIEGATVALTPTFLGTTISWLLYRRRRRM